MNKLPFNHRRITLQHDSPKRSRSKSRRGYNYKIDEESSKIRNNSVSSSMMNFQQKEQSRSIRQNRFEKVRYDEKFEQQDYKIIDETIEFNQSSSLFNQTQSKFDASVSKIPMTGVSHDISRKSSIHDMTQDMLLSNESRVDFSNIHESILNQSQKMNKIEKTQGENKSSSSDSMLNDPFSYIQKEALEELEDQKKMTCAQRIQRAKQVYDQIGGNGGLIGIANGLLSSANWQRLYQQAVQNHTFSKFKPIMYLIMIVLLPLILYSYIGILQKLGTVKSHTLKYYNHFEMNYTLVDLPQILPLHLFTMISKEDVINRIRCKVYNDRQQCFLIDKRVCEGKGETTIAYEQCMMNLINIYSDDIDPQIEPSYTRNTTEFCEKHYRRQDVWVDDLSSAFLFFYLRKHDCFLSSGVTKGKQYCDEYFKYEASWGQLEKLKCYRNNGVISSKQFCYSKFEGQLGQENNIIQCLTSEGVPADQDICQLKFRDPALVDELILCLTDVNSKDRLMCEAKFNSSSPILGFNQDKDRLIQCLSDYGYQINKEYCDGYYQNIDNIFDCYERINLGIKKDRNFCELKHPTSSSKKYDCILEIAQEQVLSSQGRRLSQDLTLLKGDYCFATYSWDFQYKELYECFAQFGIAKNGEFCEMEYEYLKSQDRSWPIQNYYDCLENELGIPNTDIDCESLDSESLIATNSKREIVANLSSFLISQNLETKEKMVNYTYDELIGFRENSIISSKSFQFIGYQFQFSFRSEGDEEQSSVIWFLEPNWEEFMNYFYSFSTHEMLNQTYGTLLFRRQPSQSSKQLNQTVDEIYYQKQLFDDPDIEIRANVDDFVGEETKDDGEGAKEAPKITAQVMGIEIQDRGITSQEMNQNQNLILYFILEVIALLPEDLTDDIESFLIVDNPPQSTGYFQNFKAMLDESSAQSNSMTLIELFYHNYEDPLIQELIEVYIEISSSEQANLLSHKILNIEMVDYFVEEATEQSRAFKAILDTYTGPEQYPVIAVLIDEFLDLIATQEFQIYDLNNRLIEIDAFQLIYSEIQAITQTPYGDFKKILAGGEEGSEKNLYTIGQDDESFISLIVLQGNIDDYILNNGSQIFTDTVAGILGLDQSQINVVRVEEGSVLVYFQIQGDNLNELKNSLVGALAQNQIQIEGYPVIGAQIGEFGEEKVVQDGVIVANGYPNMILTETESNQKLIVQENGEVIISMTQSTLQTFDIAGKMEAFAMGMLNSLSFCAFEGRLCECHEGQMVYYGQISQNYWEESQEFFIDIEKPYKQKQFEEHFILCDDRSFQTLTTQPMYCFCMEKKTTNDLEDQLQVFDEAEDQQNEDKIRKQIQEYEQFVDQIQNVTIFCSNQYQNCTCELGQKLFFGARDDEIYLKTNVTQIDLWQNYTVYEEFAVDFYCGSEPQYLGESNFSLDDPLPGKMKYCFCSKDEDYIFYDVSDVVDALSSQEESFQILKETIDVDSSKEQSLNIYRSLMDIFTTSCEARKVFQEVQLDADQCVSDLESADANGDSCTAYEFDFGRMLLESDLMTNNHQYSEPIWYQFIVNEDINSWAVLMTYDEEYSEFYLWTAKEDICQLNLDLQNYEKFTVSECSLCSCPYVQQNGWTESQIQYDENGEDPVFMIGPNGYEWTFLNIDQFYESYPLWFQEFYDQVNTGSDKTGSKKQSLELYIKQRREAYAGNFATSGNCGFYDTKLFSSYYQCCGCRFRGTVSEESDMLASYTLDYWIKSNLQLQTIIHQIDQLVSGIEDIYIIHLDETNVQEIIAAIFPQADISQIVSRVKNQEFKDTITSFYLQNNRLQLSAIIEKLIEQNFSVQTFKLLMNQIGQNAELDSCLQTGDIQGIQQVLRSDFTIQEILDAYYTGQMSESSYVFLSKADLKQILFDECENRALGFDPSKIVDEWIFKSKNIQMIIFDIENALDSSDYEHLNDRIVTADLIDTIFRKLETFNNATNLSGQIRNLTQEPMLQTYLKLFMSDVGQTFGDSLENLVSLQAAGHIFEELVVIFDELNDIPTCYLTSHDVFQQIAEFEGTLIGTFQEQFLTGQIQNLDDEDKTNQIRYDLEFNLFQDCRDGIIDHDPLVILDKWILSSSSLQEAIYQIERVLEGEQNTEFKEKFVTPIIYEDIIQDLSLNQDLSQFMLSLSQLQTIPTINQFFDFANSSLEQEPAIQDLTRIFFNGTNITQSLFKELTMKYQNYNRIISCFLTQQDLEVISQKYFSSSHSSLPQQLIDDFFDKDSRSSRVNALRDTLKIVLYNDCDDDFLASNASKVIDQWIRETQQLQVIILESEKFIDGPFIQDFRAQNFGQSKILNKQNYMTIVTSLSLESERSAVLFESIDAILSEGQLAQIYDQFINQLDSEPTIMDLGMQLLANNSSKDMFQQLASRFYTIQRILVCDQLVSEEVEQALQEFQNPFEQVDLINQDQEDQDYILLEQALSDLSFLIYHDCKPQQLSSHPQLILNQWISSSQSLQTIIVDIELQTQSEFNRNISRKFLNGSIYEDIVSDLSQSSDFLSLYQALGSLQRFQSIHSQILLIKTQLNSQPTVGEVLSFLIQNQSSSLIFQELALEFKINGQIPSCYLTQNDVERVIENFISDITPIQMMAQGYTTGIKGQLVDKMEQNLADIFYEDCDYDNISSDPLHILDKWILQSTELQNVITQVEQYLSGQFIAEFREKNYGNSKIISQEVFQIIIEGLKQSDPQVASLIGSLSEILALNNTSEIYSSIIQDLVREPTLVEIGQELMQRYASQDLFQDLAFLLKERNLHKFKSCDQMTTSDLEGALNDLQTPLASEILEQLVNGRQGQNDISSVISQARNDLSRVLFYSCPNISIRQQPQLVIDNWIYESQSLQQIIEEVEIALMGQGSQNIKDKFLNSESYQEIYAFLTKDQNYSILVASVEKLHEFSSLEQFFNQIEQEIENNVEPTIDDIIGILIGDVTMPEPSYSHQIFADLALEYEHLNNIPSCYLTQKDVKQMVNQFTLGSPTSAKLIEGFISNQYPDERIELLYDVAMVFYDKCFMDSLKEDTGQLKIDQTNNIIDTLIEQSQGMQQIIKETENFIQGEYVQQFRNRSYGNSKLINSETLTQILLDISDHDQISKEFIQQLMQLTGQNQNQSLFQTIFHELENEQNMEQLGNFVQQDSQTQKVTQIFLDLSREFADRYALPSCYFVFQDIQDLIQEAYQLPMIGQILLEYSQFPQVDREQSDILQLRRDIYDSILYDCRDKFLETDPAIILDQIIKESESMQRLIVEIETIANEPEYLDYYSQKLFDQESYEQIMQDMQGDQEFNHFVDSMRKIIQLPDIGQVYNAQISKLADTTTMEYLFQNLVSSEYSVQIFSQLEKQYQQQHNIPSCFLIAQDVRDFRQNLQSIPMVKQLDDLFFRRPGNNEQQQNISKIKDDLVSMLDQKCVFRKQWNENLTVFDELIQNSLELQQIIQQIELILEQSLQRKTFMSKIITEDKYESIKQELAREEDYSRFYTQALKFKNYPGFASWFQNAFQVVLKEGFIKDTLANQVSSFQLFQDLTQLRPFDTREICYFFSDGHYNIFEDPQYEGFNFFDPPYQVFEFVHTVKPGDKPTFVQRIDLQNIVHTVNATLDENPMTKAIINTYDVGYEARKTAHHPFIDFFVEDLQKVMTETGCEIIEQDGDTLEIIDRFLNQSWVVQLLILDIDKYLTETVIGRITIEDIYNVLYLENVLESQHLKTSITQIVEKIEMFGKEHPMALHFFNDIKTDERQSVQSKFLALETIGNSLVAKEIFKDILRERKDFFCGSNGQRRRALDQETYITGSWKFENHDTLVVSLDDEEKVVRIKALDPFSIEVKVGTLLEESKFNQFQYSRNSQGYDLQETYGRVNNNFIKNVQNTINVELNSGERTEMDCHFSGEYQDETNFPYIKIKLDKKQVIKKLRIFNADNGPYTSLLEDSEIFVGDQKCAKAGPQLLRNEHMNLTCEQIGTGSRNRFEDSVEQISEFDGILGDEITIQATKLGILMICDIEIISTEYISNVQELQDEIDRKKETCRQLQDFCRSNFEIVENRQICLERYGIPKTQEFCSGIIPATSDIFEYKLKNKWDCLLSPHHDFVSLDQISEEYVNCVGLYFDYKVENCLQNLQNQGLEATISPVNLRQKNIIQTASSSIDVTDQEIETFLCENTNTLFYSNPTGQPNDSITVEMICEVFTSYDYIQEKNMSSLHYFFEDLLDSKNYTQQNMTVLKTDANKMQFQTSFSKELQYLETSSMLYKAKATMDFTKVNIVFNASIQNDLDYLKMRGDSDSIKIYETEMSTVAFSKPVEINIGGDPSTNIHIQVENQTGMYVTTLPKLFPWLGDKICPCQPYLPLEFLNYTEPVIDLKPKNQKVPLVYLNEQERDQENFTSTVDIKMKFIEKRFTFVYNNLSDCLSPLGGVSQIITQMFASNAQLILIIFCIWMTLTTIVDNKDALDRIFIEEEIKNLRLYKEYLESLQWPHNSDRAKEDLKMVNQLMVDVKNNEKWKQLIPEDCIEYNNQDLQNLKPCECQESDILENCKTLSMKYKDKIRREKGMFDSTHILKKFYSQRAELGFMKQWQQVKLSVSFYQLYLNARTFKTKANTLKVSGKKFMYVSEFLVEKQQALFQHLIQSKKKERVLMSNMKRSLNNRRNGVEIKNLVKLKKQISILKQQVERRALDQSFSTIKNEKRSQSHHQRKTGYFQNFTPQGVTPAHRGKSILDLSIRDSYNLSPILKQSNNTLQNHHPVFDFENAPSQLTPFEMLGRSLNVNKPQNQYLSKRTVSPKFQNNPSPIIFSQETFENVNDKNEQRSKSVFERPSVFRKIQRQNYADLNDSILKDQDKNWVLQRKVQQADIPAVEDKDQSISQTQEDQQ